ncbi:GerAB/ArcD/ProY family transporter [Paenibacillus spiritus]|uniref:GerAB/ArcD/ProY family transporter n=1 Tax=Paenibacillus spiritus TaxID=2496557 RepID=A0A5J5GK57_9BACL|nr:MULTISPECIES: endospore germination permease [Paenibacillus]KAA9008490.1 GerAB/ArcD/ProY family transporter [Paenibacillus spiritus]
MKTQQISTIRATTVIASAVAGVGILSFPRYMADAGNTAAPLVTLAGVGVALVDLVIVALLSARFPRENLFQFSSRLLGRRAAWVMNLVLMFFFLMLTSLTVRQFGEVASTVLFQRTPIEAVILLMLVLATLSSRRGIVKFSYIHYFYFPLIIGSIAFILLFSIRKISVIHLMPPGGVNVSASKFMKGMLETSALFDRSFVLTLIVPFMEKPGKAMRAGLLGIGITGLIYLSITAAAIGMLGVEEVKLLFYPTLEVARSISAGEGLLERLDALFIIIWVISVYTTVYTTYYICSYLLRHLLHLQDQRLASSALLPFMFALAMVPENIFISYTAANRLAIAGLAVLTGYPLLLLALALLRRVKGDSV